MFPLCSLVPKLSVLGLQETRWNQAGTVTLSSLVEVLLKARGAHLPGGSTGLYSVSPEDTWEILRVDPHSRRENCPDRT